MNNFDQVEREVMQEAVFRYERFLRRQVRELRCFLKKLKAIGLYSKQADEIREAISAFEEQQTLCKSIMERL